jgi:hypothetical protein
VKVDITDLKAISALSPTAVTAHLRAKGWVAVESDTAFAVFERLAGETRVGVDVPLRSSSGDYARRIVELLQNLELIEGRSQLEIYRDVLHANQDVVRLSIDVPEVGRIGLDEASTLFSATRDLVLAAACSAHARRPYFPHRKPPRAMEYVRKVRLAPPEAGSFVVVLESPVAPALSATDGASDPLAEPFERVACVMLATAGARVRSSISDTTVTGSVDGFTRAVQDGVNANYCEALARLLEDDDGRNVVMSFSWASSRPAPVAVPTRVAFSRSDAEILQIAARYLKERVPIMGFELIGPIVRLQSAAPTAGGEVMIAGIVDGGIRQVMVSLGGEDYQLAAQAHHQGLAVSVEGELMRDGRSYRLAHPHVFAVMGPADSD